MATDTDSFGNRRRNLFGVSQRSSFNWKGRRRLNVPGRKLVGSARRDREAARVLDEVILEQVGRFPVDTRVLYERTCDVWGTLCKRRFYRALERLVSKGLLLRSSGKRDFRGHNEPDLFSRPRAVL